MLFIKLAWRNLFRNKRRTIIAGLAMGVALGALIFMDALFVGEETSFIHIATSTFIGEAQINRKGYRIKQTADLTIEDFPEVIETLKVDETVKALAPRVQVFGTISSAADIRGVSIFGISPQYERDLSVVDESMVEGEYFSGDNPRDIIIGTELADIMDVEMDDRVVLTVSQPKTGDISQELFRISGVFDFGDKSMNSGAVFIRLDKAREMLDIGETAHTIAILFTNPEQSRDTTSIFWGKYSQPPNEAVSWASIMPDIAMISDMMVIGKVFLAAVLMGVVVFVILNTLFMALYERMFELGVLRAVGTRPGAIAKLLLFEAGALSIVGIVLGVILGFGVTTLIAKIGIDFTGVEFSGIALREKIYPILKLNQFIIYPIGVFIFTIIVGIYPAIHAAKIAPAEAMRRSF